MKTLSGKVFFLTFLLAFFLRFINFSNRWGLGYDQASFAIIGKHAVDSWSLPLLGPFSSGGPFQTSGLWYWAVSSGNIFFPHLIEGPWIFMGILSIATVAAIMLAGTILGGKPLGLAAGFFAAISTAQITQSTNLSNQTPIALPSALALISSFAYVKTSKPVYLFFLGLSIGIASAIHLQGIGLMPLIIATLLVGKRISFRHISLLFLGISIPWIPVLFADAQHDWYNTRNMVRYYTVDQYTISLDVLGRRWKTFLAEFTVSLWGFTIGGYRWTGILSLLSGILISFYHLGTRKLSRQWIVLLMSLGGMFVVVRYARVPLYESFVVFLHPFILLTTAGIAVFLARTNKYLGIMFILILLASTMARNYEEISKATNKTAVRSMHLRQFLSKRYPEKQFALYDYKFQTASTTLPLLLYLDQNDMLRPTGHKIGLSMPTKETEKYPTLFTDETGVTVYDLEASATGQLTEAQWAYLDFPVIYKSVEHWW